MFFCYSRNGPILLSICYVFYDLASNLIFCLWLWRVGRISYLTLTKLDELIDFQQFLWWFEWIDDKNLGWTGLLTCCCLVTDKSYQTFRIKFAISLWWIKVKKIACIRLGLSIINTEARHQPAWIIIDQLAEINQLLISSCIINFQKMWYNMKQNNNIEALSHK